MSAHRLIGFLTAHASRHKDLFGGIKDVATVLALVIGGLWTYTLTKQFRDTVPRLTIKHEVHSWKLQDGSVLVRIDSNLTNTGKVQIQGLNGHIHLNRLLPETQEQLAAYKQGRIFVSCAGNREQSHCVPEQWLNLPSSSKKDFPIKDPEWGLEPGEARSYWRYCVLDSAAKVVELQTSIEVPGSSSADWHAVSIHELTPLDTSTDSAPPVHP